MPVLNPQFFQKKFTLEDIDYFVLSGERRNCVMNGMLRVGRGGVLFR